jgi:phosphoribosylanthranilate isomerase
MTAVKICGIKRAEDGLAAAAASADMLGFVFAASKRQVSPEAAAEIIRRVRAEHQVRAVGVFVNAPAEEMNRVARLCELDYVQLSGDEEPEIIERLEAPAIQVIRVPADAAPDRLEEQITSAPAALVLLDTARAGSYGGTGEAFPWELVPALRRPVLLAGGLHAGNVAQAIRVLHPWGVDVSSGVEINGEKDHGRIADFIRAAHG